MRIYRWHASCYAHARAHSLLVLVSHAEPPDIYQAIWCNTRTAQHRRYDMSNVATHIAAPAYVLEFSNPTWSVYAISTTGQYYTVECIRPWS